MEQDILDGYEAAAGHLIASFEALSSQSLLEPVAAHLPPPQATVLDVGAGTGRDAAWFASRACQVVAAEPVKALREAGMRFHTSRRIAWVQASLPDLVGVDRHCPRFDFILLSGVWQHVPPEQRAPSMLRLRELSAPGGRLVISVRHGPGAPGRRCFATSDEEAIDVARDRGFEVIDASKVASVQQWNRTAGVTWTWLVFSAS